MRNRMLPAFILFVSMCSAVVAAESSLTTENLTVFGKTRLGGPVEIGPISVTNNLMLYYSFDTDNGSIVDSSGRGNNGNAVGTIAYEAGLSGQAAKFTSSSTYIVVPAAELNMNGWTGFTVSVWVYPYSLNTYSFILSRGGITNSTQGGFNLWTPGYEGYEGSGFSVLTNVETGTMAKIIDEPRSAVDTWTHYVCTCTPTSMSFYVNGQLKAQQALSLSQLLDAQDTQLAIGTIATSPFNEWGDMFLDGKLDELRIYNRELSQDEVSALYYTNPSNAASTVMMDVKGNVVIRGTISGNGSGMSNVTASSVAANSPLASQMAMATNASKWVESISSNLSVNSAGYVAVKKLEVAQDTVFRGPVTLGSSLPSAGLCLNFDFNANNTVLQDLSGNGNNGTVYGGPAWTNNGARDGSFLLDGIDDCVLGNNSASLQITNQLTLLAWIRTSTSGYSGIICKQPSAGAAYNTPGNYEFMLDNTGKPRFRFEYGTTNVEAIVATHAVNNGQWHQVGVTVDSATKAVKFYIDGILDKSATAVNVPLQNLNSDPVRIGKRKDGCFFAGGMDEPAVYNRILSDSEISSLFNSGALTARKVNAASELWVDGKKVADTNGVLSSALPAGVVMNGSSPTFGTITGTGSGLTGVPVAGVVGLGTIATMDANSFATAAQGTKADNSLPKDGSVPLTGDLDLGKHSLVNGSYIGNGSGLTNIPGTAIVGGVSGGGGLIPANNLSDVPDKAAARSNLELGSAATMNAGAFASSQQLTDHQNAQDQHGLVNADVILKSQYDTGDYWNNVNLIDRARRADFTDYSLYATEASTADTLSQGSPVLEDVAKGKNAWDWIQQIITTSGNSDLSMGSFTQGR